MTETKYVPFYPLQTFLPFIPPQEFFFLVLGHPSRVIEAWIKGKSLITLILHSIE